MGLPVLRPVLAEDLRHFQLKWPGGHGPPSEVCRRLGLGLRGLGPGQQVEGEPWQCPPRDSGKVFGLRRHAIPE
jgi:hypothetical protein